MIVKIDKSLQKDIKKVNNQSIKNKLAKIIESIQNEELILVRLLHRKDIYRYVP